MLADIKASRIYDTTTLPVALREVRNLIRGGPPGGAEPIGRSRWPGGRPERVSRRLATAGHVHRAPNPARATTDNPSGTRPAP